MDYDPRDEAAIGQFLSEAEFEYAIGSVHHLEDVNVHSEQYFADKSDAERAALAERYVEKLVAMIDSELFDIAAHIDILERNPALRGYLSTEQYHRIADAFERSRTVPELNAGRVLDSYGNYHPTSELFDVLRARDIRMTIGSDAHSPVEVTDRVEHLESTVAERSLDPLELSLGE